MSNLSDYAGYVDAKYLELAAEVGRRDKQLTYAAMRIQPGQRVLDVGCGPGLDTLALAPLVGAGGQVVGVDHDPAMVAEADQRAAAAGYQAWVTHAVADATALPFAAGAFDACRSERLFQHLADPAAALSEMARVTRAGGRVVVLDTDYSSITIDSDETELERRLARFTGERLRSGYAARRLARLFARQGLAGVSVEISPQPFLSYELVRMGWLEPVEREALAAGAITDEELARWRRNLEANAAAGGFFASLNHVLVAGDVP